MKIFELLFEDYKTVRAKWVKSGADASSVDTIIAQYREMINAHRISGDQKNIDWWGKKSWEEFKSFVDAQYASPSVTQVKRKKVVGKSITVREDNEWLIVIPLDREASCFHGKDSDWCVSKPRLGHFEDYFHRQDILVFCINELTGGMWAILVHYANDKLFFLELFDEEDKEISQEEFLEQTGINAHDLARQIYKDHYAEIKTELTNIDKANRYVSWWLQNNKTPVERDKKVELMLSKLNNMGYILQYITAIGKSLGPQHFPEKISRVLFDTMLDNDFDWETQYRENLKNALPYIKDPSDSLQLMMVEKIPEIISSLENPPLKVQLWILENAPVLFSTIKNQKEDAQLAAIKYLNQPEKSIKNPTEKVQLELIKKRPLYIANVENPSDVMKMTAIKINGYAVTLIDNPTLEMWKIAIKITPGVIERYPNPPLDLQLIAVNSNPGVVQKIKPFAAKEAQIAAIKKQPTLIWGIQKPFPEAIELAQKFGVDIKTP